MSCENFIAQLNPTELMFSSLHGHSSIAICWFYLAGMQVSSTTNWLTHIWLNAQTVYRETRSKQGVCFVMWVS